MADKVAAEAPLELAIGYGLPGARCRTVVATTMRTPGDDEALGIGFLYAEGAINQVSDVLAVVQHSGGGSMRIELAPHVHYEPRRLQRHFFISSACGVCGKWDLSNSESRFGPRPLASMNVDPSVIGSLPEALETTQRVFHSTGGLHAAALFSREGKLLCMREDVGRHNAFDKLIGACLRERIPTENQIVLVSGRSSYELVQKAIAARIAVLAAIGAPSSLAVELSEQFDLTLIGFLRATRFNVYASAWRLQS